MDGFLNINKPQGITSYDVIRAIKRMFRLKDKIGHTGTLDPLASGVLVICIGKATKTAQQFLDMEKEYVATMKFGIVTDTDDIQGKILETHPVNPALFTEERIRAILKEFEGEIDQVPPSVSAIHHKGRRLYQLHRSGRPVIPDPRKVTVKQISIEHMELPLLTFRVICTRGTYVRALCRDIGMKFGCGGTQEKLVRQRIGKFTLRESVTLEQIEKDGIGAHLLPVSCLLG
jgi:tRNA pseudouridine55 synthase